MAESTLSVTFTELRKKVAHFLGYQRSFSEGTANIEAGAVTFNDTADGTRFWPSWSADGLFIYNSNKYTIASLTNVQPPLYDSTLTLNDAGNTALSNVTNAPYELVPWDDRKFEDIDSAVENGLRRFYYPYIESEGQIYQWTFLRKEGAITLTSTESKYVLADDVAQIVEDSVTYGIEEGNKPLTRVSEGEIRKMQQESETGVPLYYAVRPKHESTNPTDGQRFEIVVHPTPSSSQVSESITYRYVSAPDLLTTTNIFPLGGALHSQTLIEACLAEAEKDMDDRSDVHEQAFQKLLIASYRADMEVREMEVSGGTSYDIDAATYGTYQWLQQEVGLYAINNTNPDTFTVGEDKLVDSIIQSGVKQFYFPPMVEGQKEPYKWSFLCPTTTVSLVTGEFEYTLPSDFGQILGEFTWPTSSSGTTRIPLVSVERLLQMRGDEGATGDPKWAAVRPIAAALTSAQTWEVLFYPVADAGANGKALSYRYLKDPDVMSLTNLYPAGGTVHAETLLASCLAIAELRKKGETGDYATFFMNRLTSSIQVDTQALSVTEVDTYADIEPTFGTYQWFQQEVGDYMNFGANPMSWSQSEKREVDSIITRGLKKFYTAPPLPGEGTVAHEWSFMAPEATITIWGDTAYTANAADPDGTSIITFATPSQTVHQTMVGKTIRFTTSENEYTIASITSDVVYTTANMAGESASDTVTVVSDGDYMLPADHGGFVSDSIKYDESADSYYSMRVTSVARILELRQSNTGSDSPMSRSVEAAYKPNSDTTRGSQQRAIMMVWPKPDSDYLLHYQYHAIQPKLTESKNYPIGTDTHAETILSSCLAVAELKKTGRSGFEAENFIRLLMSSVSRDRMAFAPKVFGKNLDYSDSGGSRGRRYKSAQYFDGSIYHGGD